MGSMVLHMADDMSKPMQGSSVSATQGQNLMKMTVTALQSVRSKGFSLVLAENGKETAEIGV